MENQKPSNKQLPSNRSMTDMRGRPLSPIQNQTAPSARSSTVKHPSIGSPSDGRPSVGRPSDTNRRPSVARSSVGAPSAGARSVGTPAQPVLELSADALAKLYGTGTIHGATGRDFMYPSDLRLFLNDEKGKPLRDKWLTCSCINVYCELILDRSDKSDELPNIYVFPTRFGPAWKLGLKRSSWFAYFPSTSSRRTLFSSPIM